MSEQVQAYYIGRRINGNKVVYAWLCDGEEKPRLYAKNVVTYAMVGERFVLTQNADKAILLKGPAAPKSVTGARSPMQKQWVAEDAAAQQRAADIRAEKKLKERRSEFESALEPLRLMVLSVKRHDDKAALIARITSELWRV